jgi:alpha-beta hydrolase superfamily lysophospholipase
MNAVLDAAPPQVSGTSESFVRFGPGGQMTGILAGPPTAGPVLLLPSAGLQPRMGPFRLHVLLARRLAAAGIRSFRYDIPGVGEVPRLPSCDATQATIAAMDQLEAMHGARAFAIGGICSAADTGWDVANLDQRVRAVLMLDGVCFTGPWYHYARILGLIQRLPREWRRFAGKLRGRMHAGPRLDSTAFRTWPSRAQARQQFADLVARDVRLLWIYSGGYADRFLHPAQFEWSFGAVARAPGVEMQHWPDCDHTYFSQAQRDRLLTRIVAWMLELPERTPA